MVLWSLSKGIFKVASIQGKSAPQFLSKEEIERCDSIMLYKNGTVYKRSLAVLMILSDLAFPWNLMIVFRIIPPFIRDVFYSLIAENRYAWFGRNDQCRLPTPEEKLKMLD